MVTTKCECEKCIKNENGHWWCQRFADFTVSDTIELCRQFPMMSVDSCEDVVELKLKNKIANSWERILSERTAALAKAEYRRNTKVYISGPMSGIPRDEYLKRFRDCEQLLRANGYQNIVNPINVWACRWPWLYRLLGYRLVLWYDIQLLKRCDAICLMEGWSGSYGCLHELCDAWDRNMTIINERDFVKK